MRYQKRLLNGFAALMGAATVLWGQSAPATGQIKGVVQGEDGKAVHRAAVTALVQRAGVRPASVSTTTGNDGSFTLTGLAAAPYRICVQAPGSGLLNPCQWSANPPTATLTAGQIVDAGTIQLKKGAVLQVRILDDGGELASGEVKKQGSHVLLGVWTAGGLFQPMGLKNKAAKNRDYELLIPYDTTLQLSITSRTFKLADEKGVAVDAKKGVNVPLQIASGSAAKTITYRVTGLNGN